MKKRLRSVLLIILLLLGIFTILKSLLLPYFVEKRNEKILTRLKDVELKNYMIFNAFIHDIEKETGWQILITSGYRTDEEQEILKKRDTRNARAGQSKHNFGKAIDINLYQNTWITGKWLLKSSSKKHWEDSGVLKIAKRYNLKWGGDFKSYYDPVHFEIE
jgi:D-alanyl-D-alanine carboxypeptidase